MNAFVRIVLQNSFLQRLVGNEQHKPYYFEIVQCLPAAACDAFMADLEVFDRTGTVSPGMQNVLKRIGCMAEADRIIVARMPPGEIPLAA